MADILLKDLDGTPVEKEGVDKGINVLLTDGTEKIYVDSGEVPEAVVKSVSLDFTYSNTMYVTPEDGQVFSNVVIGKPTNLLPDNIRENINIAGIIGTMVAGSGGDGVQVKSGYCTFPNGGVGHVSVDFGFNPDFLLLVYDSNKYAGSAKFLFFGVSSGLAAKIQTSIPQYYAYRASSYVYMFNASYPIDNTDNVCISHTDAAGFDTSLDGVSSGKYLYIAIGGLA